MCLATTLRAGANRLTPAIVTEFGREKDAHLFKKTQIKRLRNSTVHNNASWVVWALPGVYRGPRGPSNCAGYVGP
ncbi:Uu.00g142510.m01.CDS01 [Anthostomella pinea]|uniref:Uu.00g142510.m01.CDS01 n=1 Tax=Anthostomella pinea TaxID=933095 RepID=A0AAI8VQJ5_9PEZI|nr:Uu.00g142510.m01.CDS01 [Anthostomella pinea]